MEQTATIAQTGKTETKAKRILSAFAAAGLLTILAVPAFLKTSAAASFQLAAASATAPANDERLVVNLETGQCSREVVRIGSFALSREAPCRPNEEHAVYKNVMGNQSIIP